MVAAVIGRRRQWHPTPVLLPGKSHGRRSLVGCSPWGRQESDTTDQLRFHFSLSCIGKGNGNPLQCSCLENPRDEGAWWAAVYGVAQSQTRLKQLSSSSSRLKKKNLLESQMLCLCCRNSGNHILPSEHTFFKLAAKLLCSRETTQNIYTCNKISLSFYFMTTEQTSEVEEIIYKAFKQCFLLNNLSLMYQMSEIPELIM